MTWCSIRPRSSSNHLREVDVIYGHHLDKPLGDPRPSVRNLGVVELRSESLRTKLHMTLIRFKLTDYVSVSPSYQEDIVETIVIANLERYRAKGPDQGSRMVPQRRNSVSLGRTSGTTSYDNRIRCKLTVSTIIQKSWEIRF